MTKRICGLVAVAMTLAPAAFAMSLQNGDFQNSTPLNFWTTTGNASLATGTGTVKALRLHETCAPGLSRAFQTFDIPVNAAALSFRYRLTSPITPDDGNCPGLMETSAIPLPPDAFMAFLIDPNGDRIIPHDPNFTEALLYHEAGSAAVVDSAYVTIEPPDSDGLRRVGAAS